MLELPLSTLALALVVAAAVVFGALKFIAYQKAAGQKIGAIKRVNTHYNRAENYATPNDVAAYLVWKSGPMSVMKLNRLLYLAQAASIAHDRRLLFHGDLVAKATGPSSADIIDDHGGKGTIDKVEAGRVAMLDKQAQSRVDEVLTRFGKLDETKLNALTCIGPWKQARAQASTRTEGDPVIDPRTLPSFWKHITTSKQAVKAKVPAA